ncbi:antA/AntB antirepressor family protein [Bartonella sp. cb54]|uniref:antA/AntB antirepressor family protein n=1 Tax=Bartonella sp. cb54 TaxID=3385560 RepID=UPI0039A4BDEE
MNTLIEITEQAIGQETVQAINARELHTFLEVKSEFRNWIKNRIEEYAFSENQDFISFGKNLPKPSGGRPSMEYHITLDMAKELSMVERNEKGRQARRYFIECEKKLKSQSVGYELLSDECLKNPAGVGKILGVMMRRLLDANDLEEELEQHKALIAEAKRILENPLKKVA